MSVILKTTELRKYYGKEPNVTKALDGGSLEVQKGEFDEVNAFMKTYEERPQANVKYKSVTMVAEEFAVMPSIGMTRRQLRKLFVVEGLRKSK